MTWVRPDGKVFARSPEDDGDHAECRDDDAERWLDAGWTVQRREDEYVVPTVPPVPHEFLHLEHADLEGLRLLDDELRQEVAGTAGWRWTHEDFVAETYSSPSVYLVTPPTTASAVCGCGADAAPGVRGRAPIAAGARARAGARRRGARRDERARLQRGHDGDRCRERGVADPLPRLRRARVGGFVELARPR